MAIKIGHATIDERGKGYGGSAGDQNGKEVLTRKWYKGGWHTVLRPKSATLADKSAAACEAACANSKIGYDQTNPDRNTLYKRAKDVGFDLSKIDTACECDCSSLMHVCVIAGGANLKYGSNAFTTRTMVNRLVASGEYEALTDSKYLTSDAQLKRGDILVKTGHTVMVLEDGANVKPKAKTITLKLTELQKGSQGNQVKTLQRVLSTYGYSLGSKNPFDGKFGSKTDAAVREFQADNKLTVDGIVGAKTWNKLLGN